MNERVAVITGGEGDLARAIAAELRQSGWQVHAPARGSNSMSMRRESVEQFFAGIERLDLLINNAGSRDDALCSKMTPEQWDRVITTNLRGAFLCSQAAALKMIKQRTGHIINISSFAARSATAASRIIPQRKLE